MVASDRSAVHEAVVKAILVAAIILMGCGTARGPDYRPPPGALNPAVTQKTIRTTICVPGWTATVRPSTSSTNRLKSAQIKARRLPGLIGGYEEDHWIPLELGGAPKDPRNLWPEARTGPHASAAGKDRAENRLKRAVCDGSLTLAAARARVVDPREWKKK